jgi:Cu2+-exporting ATPase
MSTRADQNHHAHHGHGQHPPHTSGEGHAHHHAEEFRRRFWVSLGLSVPVVAFSPMIRDWLGLADVTGVQEAVAPVFGTLVFLYGGRPFLAGAVSELRMRQPEMMMLIALAICVAFLASAASALGLLDLEFWWELAALIVIMLLGHWLEMRAVGQARGALQALAELLPGRLLALAGAPRIKRLSRRSRPDTRRERSLTFGALAPARLFARAASRASDRVASSASPRSAG